MNTLPAYCQHVMKLEAVIVSLNISRFSNQRRDDSITREVSALHSLAGNAGRWIKYRLDPHAFDGVTAACSQARAEHYRLTLAWENGRRLLPLKCRGKYTAAMDAIHSQFDQAVNAFVEAYPEAVENAKAMHAAKFQPDEYPAPGDGIRAQFSFAVEYSPMPQATHFNDVLSGAALEEMRESLEAGNKTRIAEATAELWERILAPVQRIATILSQDGECPTFRNSLVENVREMLDEVPEMNVTNCPRVALVASEIREMVKGMQPDVLRSYPTVRREVAARARKIIAAAHEQTGHDAFESSDFNLDGEVPSHLGKRRIML